MAFALFFLGEYANMILMSAMTTILFLGGWLAPFGIAPFTWLPGPIWFIAEDLLRAVRVHLGARDLPALPLRPADAAGLEGVPAVVAVLAGADRRRADGVRLAAACRAGSPSAMAGHPAREESERWRSWTAPRAACC